MPKAKEIEIVESKLTLALKSTKRFTVLKDDWIKDAFTGIEWGPSSEETMEFEDAIKYCEERGGRLPEIHELHSLVDFTKKDPATFDVLKDTKHDDWYWSGTKSLRWTRARWCVSFGFGYVYYNYCKLSGNYVRPVRASQ